MKRRRIVWIGLVALVSLMVFSAPGISFAGGVAVVLDRMPSDVEAGKPFTVGFSIRSAHEDRLPISDLSPAVLFTNSVTDERVQEIAKADGDAGHYAVSITLPSAGAWRWQVQPFGAHEMDVPFMQPTLEVHAPGTAASSQKPAPTGELIAIKAGDSFFEPQQMTVAVGTTVRWENTGLLPHTVTAADGQFASGFMDVGQTFEYTFTEPGTYQYYCEYHAARPQGQSGEVQLISHTQRPSSGGGGGGGMIGSITVTAAKNEAQAAPSVLNQSAAQAADSTSEQTSTLPSTGIADAPWFILAAVALLGSVLGLVLRRRSQHNG